MRIDKDQKIGGVAALDVRRMLRRFAHLSLSAKAVAEFLQISPRAASKLVRKLSSDGYIEAVVGDTFECTVKGSALIGASSSLPLRRATAKRILTQVVLRAAEINATEQFVFRVTRLELFGSALTAKDRPSDVDLAFHLEPRWGGDAQRVASRARIAAAIRGGRRFPSFIDELTWPETEVLRALRGRSRGLSLTRLERVVEMGATRKVIFEA